MESENERPRRRKYDKMADRAVNWIGQMWPILVGIVGLAFHSGIAKASIAAEIQHLKTAHKFEMKAIEDNVKRNEIRTARLESSIINSESKLSNIDKKLDNVVNSLSNLKYIYVSKEEARGFITKDMIDGRLIKSK